MKLRAGRFYVTTEGARWCCFFVDEQREPHCQAYCIEVATHRIEYFYLDGRYDVKGIREHTLVRELAEGL